MPGIHGALVKDRGPGRAGDYPRPMASINGDDLSEDRGTVKGRTAWIGHGATLRFARSSGRARTRTFAPPQSRLRAFRGRGAGTIQRTERQLVVDAFGPKLNCE